MDQSSVNKGTGAGGAKTNVVGKSFEQLTSNEPRLIAEGFIRTNMTKGKYGYYLFRRADLRYI